MTSIDIKDDRSENVHYDFEEYPIYIRRSLLSTYHDFKAPAHWHTDIELIAVLKGKMDYFVNGDIITMKQSEGIFINSRQLHYGFSKTKKECEFICILIHPLMLCVTQTMAQKYVVPVTKDDRAAYIKLSADEPWKQEVLGAILRMYHEKDTKTAPLTLTASFLKIWSLIYERSKICVSTKKQNSDLIILKNMIGYIQKFYSQKITLAAIAKAGAVGQTKCCKLFAQYTGTTPNTYLTQYRLRQSIWYLKNTDMTISEIAGAVGFSGSSYYAESFRKWCGRSPSEYRRQGEQKRSCS